MPETAEKILAVLGAENPDLTLEGRDSWGLLQPGTTIAKAAPLFPRIDKE
jgi:methionyl-tRNA synthetase